MIKPDYYHQGNIDVIKFSEENFTKEELKGFYRMNILKYVTRFDKKGSALSDLEKAKFYLDKLVEISEVKEEIKPYQPKINNPFDSIMRSFAKLSVRPELPKRNFSKGGLDINRDISTYRGGTNPLD